MEVFVLDIRYQKFGYLTVLRKGDPYPSGPARWWCSCELCGKEKLISQQALINGNNVSCGCKRQMRLADKICPKCGTACVRRVNPPNGYRCPKCVNEHRKNKYHQDNRSILLNSARSRATKLQVSFDIVKEDIIIPKTCPVLGIELEVGDRHFHDNSPSLDRLRPEIGYTPENIRVISWRANRIKCNGTLEELEKIVTYMRLNGL
jgi:hypothetical protein